MIKDYLHLSYSSLIHRGVRSWLTIIGIFIGIAAVISLISLGQGLRGAVMSQFNFLSTDILTVQASGVNYGPPGSGVVNPLKEKFVQDLERITGVDAAIGRLIKSTTLEFNDKSEGGVVASIPDSPKREMIKTIIQLEIQQGRLLRDGDANAVVLGNNYANSPGLEKEILPGNTVIIHSKAFTVFGVLKKRGSFIIDNSILMNEGDVRELFSVNGTYDIIAVKVSRGTDMNSMKERLEEYLRKERNVKKGDEDFTIESPQQALADIDSILFAIQMFIYVIAGISIVVGGIGISNTMYTSVVERTKQIGIMKSIGARNEDIMGLFLIESGLLGLVGGIMGILVGLGLAYGMAFIGTVALQTDLIQVQASFSLIMGALIFSFLIGTISGLLPAIAASKLKPVDALRSAK